MADIRARYFDWMVGKIANYQYDVAEYTKLLNYLYSKEFTWLLPRDENRAKDGMDLRDRFGTERNISARDLESIDEPCSVLEMMVALALRCEEHIMANPEFDDRTSEWFWIMIENLGLVGFDDIHYDEAYVDTIVENFLDRKYERNGRGGLFHVNSLNGRDLRNTEIWYQLSWYLSEVLGAY